MKLHRLANRYLAVLGIISGVLLAAGSAHAQQLQGKALVRALQRGSYVIVMRHASSPQNPPTKENADPQNIHLELSWMKTVALRPRLSATQFAA